MTTLPTRIVIECDEHADAQHVVTFEDQLSRDPYDPYAPPLDGEWRAVDYGGGFGEGMSGSVVTARGKRNWVCGMHAPRNRKPIQFSTVGAENQTVNLLAYAGLAEVTLTEVRAFRAALVALQRQQATSLDDVARLGSLIRGAREVT